MGGLQGHTVGEKKKIKLQRTIFSSAQNGKYLSGAEIK